MAVSVNGASPVRARATRLLLAVVVSLGLLMSAACGMNAQTLKPYTPADGVNFDVGDPQNLDTVIHVRNMMLISRESGNAYLSATISSAARDALVGATITPFDVEGAKKAPVEATFANPAAFGNNQALILTDRSLITVTSDDLVVGLQAEITLKFSKAGTHAVLVPILDGTQPPYATITPSASPTTQD